MGIVDGVSAFGRALRLSWRARRLWPWLLGPMALSLAAATAGGGLGAWAGLHYLVGARHGLGGTLLTILVVLCALAMAYAIAIATSGLVLFPFAPGLSSRVELLDGGGSSEP